jgi:hypothetical protein
MGDKPRDRTGMQRSEAGRKVGDGEQAVDYER